MKNILSIIVILLFTFANSDYIDGTIISKNSDTLFGVNNITESQTFTFPLSPQLPRTFVFELGYKF